MQVMAPRHKLPDFSPNKILFLLSILRPLEGLLEIFRLAGPSGNLRHTTQTGKTN